VGEYFRKFIDAITDHIKAEQGNDRSERIDVEDISKMINDNSASEIKVMLKKIWLITFHRWIMGNCNEGTKEVMDNILKAESDWETLQIIYNSFSRPDMSDVKGQSMRKKFFNNLGHLYPGRSKSLQEAKDFKELQDRLIGSEYHKYFEKIAEPKAAVDMPEVNLMTIDDYQKIDMSRRYSMGFFSQFQYGTFYAYLKLKELEIANIVHLAEIFAIGAFNKSHAAWKKHVIPFQYSVAQMDV